MTDVAARLATLRSESMHILEVGLHAVSSLNIGIVLCNAEGQVLLANPIGQEILRLRDGLELRVDGTLCATHDDTDSIPEIIRRVAQRSDQRSSRHTSGVVAVHRAGRRRPLTALIRSVTPVDAPAKANGNVLVLILDSASPVRDIESELRQLYGFTSTEARLANLMMEGRALEDCCGELGICRSTGCTHLRQIFKKTGVHRQSELVGLLLKGIGLAYLGGAKADSAPAQPDQSSTPDSPE